MDAMGELTVRTALPMFFEIDAEDLDSEELWELRASIKGVSISGCRQIKLFSQFETYTSALRALSNGRRLF